jgi:acetolactate synthase-1/2/3 large subunit
MARGLLGRGHPLQLRHQRRRALREADLVLLAGVPCDFRVGYGRQIPQRVPVVAANRSRRELRKNRRPTVAALCDPGRFVIDLAERVAASEGAGDRAAKNARQSWSPWLEKLRRRDGERDSEIAGWAQGASERVHPLALCREIEAALPEDSVIVVDGGDFVATASYIVSPRAPLSWLDPGVFGTLGVGGGFALGAKLSRPDSEVWILYGDGSAAFSLAEFDTFVRHEIPVIAVVGTDGSWSQIARDQVELLGDDVGTVLRRTGYHGVADGYGGRGLLLDRTDRIPQVLAMAREIAAAGQPVLINALIDPSDFRKGSISM